MSHTPIPAFCFEGERMYDALYVGGTIAFFALMLAFVRGCERLGREKNPEERQP